MKRFLFYIITFLILIGIAGFFAWDYLNIQSFKDLFDRFMDNNKYKIAVAIACVYCLDCLIVFIILSYKMNKKVMYSFYGRPLEFHGETVNGVDIGRATFRNKQTNDLEAHNIYTTKCLEFPIYDSTFLIKIGANGNVKSMYELDETNKRIGEELVRFHNPITSFLMALLISVLPIVSIFIVLYKTKDM